MFKGTYKIADIVFGLDSVYEDVHRYCTEYAFDGEPEYFFTVTQEDIEFERKMSEREALHEGRGERSYSDAVYEEFAFYRKIAEAMPAHDTVLCHGSVVAVDGKGYMFIAKSGTGKSTHTRLWREMLGERAVMINDDKPMLKIADEAVYAYGTPYTGKYRLGTNTSVPLDGICIIERGETNSISPVTKGEAYSMLVQQIYRPADPLNMVRTMKLIDKLAGNTKLYRLVCNMEKEAAEVAYKGMKAGAENGESNI